jgi:hypothetical protein
MMRLLQTKVSRFLFVALMVLLVAAIAVWYGRSRYIHPTDWYFWTQDADAGIDIRSPTRRAMIDTDFTPIASWSESRVKLFEDRCDVSRLLATSRASVVTTDAEWRHVTLCNPAALKGEQFEIASGYFRTRVDELYSQMYFEMAWDLSSYIVGALAVWVVLLSGLRIGSWVKAGT